MKIERIQHIGIPVIVPEKAISFYERLGFRLVMDSPFSQCNGLGHCWMMQSGDVVIELYLLPPDELPEIASRGSGHIDHIAFDVDNIGVAFDTLSLAGFEIIEEEPHQLGFWEKGCRYFNVKGPSGETIEFCEIIK